MKPYYEQDGITIYCGDSCDVLPHIRTQSIDTVISDPPFFMPAVHYSARSKQQRTWGDTSVLRCFWSVVIQKLIKTMKPSGHCFVFCDDESYPVFYPEHYGRFDYVKSLVWNKMHFGMGRIWRNQHELIIASRWETAEFTDDGVTRADVLTHATVDPAVRLHPAQKPLSLMNDLISPTVPIGGHVLDPFMGSGTTLRAAKDLGRRAIGIEIEERYCEIAARRLEQGVLNFVG